jgi:hypothetical protein
MPAREEMGAPCACQLTHLLAPLRLAASFRYIERGQLDCSDRAGEPVGRADNEP